MSKGRFQKENSASKLLIALVAIAAVVLVVLVAMLLVRIAGGAAFAESMNTAAESTAALEETLGAAMAPTQQGTASPNQTEPVEIDSKVPCVLEDGKLEVTSVFPYTGINLDCGWQEGVNTGTIELTNISDSHLVAAQIQLEMSDGTTLCFTAKEIPAGATVWAFDQNNTSYDASAYCTSVNCTAEFASGTDVMDETVSFDINGMDIALTNTSSETLTNLQITCHSVLDGIYFGGSVFTYSVDTIAPGATTNVLAQDCFLDTAAIVKITANE